MNGEVSKSEEGPGLRKRLDEAVVLQRTVQQLRKDLRNEGLREPAVGEGAFEELRAQVEDLLAQKQREGPHALGLVVNRVDLTEGQLRTALARGGMHGVAGAVVLRCLQKVLSRMRFAGLG